jgi:hypothetical protein
MLTTRAHTCQQVACAVDLYEAQKSAVAKGGLERIAAVYAIEEEIRGRSTEEGREVQNVRSRPLLESLILTNGSALFHSSFQAEPPQQDVQNGRICNATH